MTDPTETIEPPSPEELQALLAIDPVAALSDITPEEAGHLKAALAGMVDAKLAHFRDHDDDAADQHAERIEQHLDALSTSAVILFGDVGDGIRRSRMAIMLKAYRRG